MMMRYATALLVLLFSVLFSLGTATASMGGDSTTGAQGHPAHGDVVAYEDERDDEDDDEEEEDW